MSICVSINRDQNMQNSHSLIREQLQTRRDCRPDLLLLSDHANIRYLWSNMVTRHIITRNDARQNNGHNLYRDEYLCEHKSRSKHAKFPQFNSGAIANEKGLQAWPVVVEWSCKHTLFVKQHGHTTLFNTQWHTPKKSPIIYIAMSIFANINRDQKPKIVTL